MAASVQYHISQSQIAKDAVPEAPQPLTQKWYFSRKEIECNTPSRSDGIDYKHEQHLRKMYCNFMQELGIELKVPQVTIATAMMFCHRFYMRQSHTKNDWQTVATSCMFLACKAEETPRGLGELVVVAYKLIYKWDPSATRRIREIYDKQKELIVTGERLLLTIIAFDLNVEHPYKPLVAALKKLEITHDELVKVAWNFVNDWLRTSLCLQHKPHYIAAGSLFLAAKVKKVKLPTSKGDAWWRKFEVSPKRLEDVIQQMMSLWEQSQTQTLTPKEQKVTESQTKKGTTYSPQSTLSGHKVIQDSKTTASKADAKPRKSSDNVNASNVGESSKILASMDQSSKMIASKDASEPAKSSTSNCSKLQTFDNVHDTSRATTDRHTSVNGNAISATENSELRASTNPCLAAKSVGVSQDAPICQTSDTGSAVSVIEDGDSGEPVTVKSDLSSSYNTVKLGATVVSSQVDVNRIREKLKKRNSIKTMKRKRVEDTDDEIDGDAWIERELENGIVLDSSYPEKQRKI